MAFKKSSTKGAKGKNPDSAEDHDTGKDGTWYSKGKSGEQKSEAIQEANQRGKTNRFWQKPGKSAMVTFLDSEGFYFYEHNLKLRGKWGNYFTCRKDFDNCPLCDAGDNPSYVCAFTIIDHSKYMSKVAKKEVKNRRKLLVLKARAFNKLKKRRDGDKLKGNLTLAVFELSRTSADECSTGEDFDFRRRLTSAELAKLCPVDLKGDDRKVWQKPVKYMEEFAPKSASALSRLVGASPAMGSKEDVGDASDLTGSDVGGEDLENVL